MTDRTTTDRAAEKVEYLMGLRGTEDHVWESLARWPEMREWWLLWVVREILNDPRSSDLEINDGCPL